MKEEREKEREREKSVVLDKHHFSSKGHWQLLCVMVRGEEEGRDGRTGEREAKREWGDGDAVKSIGEEKHPLVIMEKT